MKTMEKTLITVKVTVDAPVEKVWDYWTKPEHITRWSFASDDWHCPWAKNDLRKGGKFTSRMEAKDGSFGFDFGGEYTIVEPYNFIEYVMDDGREVKIKFEKDNNKTHVTETFEAETQNPVDMQKNGWQAILENFKKYAEKPEHLERLHFEIQIDTSPQKVYQTMLDKKTYGEWTAIFNPTSYYKGTWGKGSKMLFLGTDKSGKSGGMVSRIKENIPNEFVSIEHLGIVLDDKEITSGAEVDEWSGSLENYTITEENGNTLLSVEMDTSEKYKEYFSETWPVALQKIKEICESD